MNEKLKTLFLWGFVTMVMISVFSNLQQHHQASQNTPYSEFINAVMQGEVSQVSIVQQDITGVRNGSSFHTYMPISDPYLLNELIKKNVVVTGRAPEQPSMLMHMLISWLPFIIILLIWFVVMRQMNGGGGGLRGPLSFGRSRAKVLNADQVKVKFKDVAGVDEAKEEISELVEFLKDPSRFHRLGGRVPRGALLVGEPGTGKTLLAKAVAGEASVPFFSISGSDFVEMFVGVGASRVRDMFEQAKKQAPCIIFIDEIDAVGRKRNASPHGGGHDEREQTLNQLLVEMDGFEGKEGVIVMAATNRPDVLDNALLRPGRFDRQIYVPLPDILGREAILKVHAKELMTDGKVDLKALARGTSGFSGADLANLANEAALIAARMNLDKINMAAFEQAKDKIMMGTERRSMVMSDQEKRLTAYHEAGHAIVGLSLPEHDPVYKVTIIPRGRALGVTMFLPEEDRYSHSLLRLRCEISSLFGGRIAEALIFGEDQVTTGASNDIERATRLAKNAVLRWGLSKKVGPINYGDDEQSQWAMMGGQARDCSDETSRVIDAEIRELIDSNYQRAEDILKSHIDKLHVMAEALLKFETIDTVQIEAIMAGASLEEIPEPDLVLRPKAKRRVRRKAAPVAEDEAETKH